MDDGRTGGNLRAICARAAAEASRTSERASERESERVRVHARFVRVTRGTVIKRVHECCVNVYPLVTLASRYLSLSLALNYTRVVQFISLDCIDDLVTTTRKKREPDSIEIFAYTRPIHRCDAVTRI